MYADDIVLVADTEMELQTMLEVVQAYVMRWRMKFNRSKSKIMAVRKREGGTSWKIGEKITEEVEEFKYLGGWFDGKLRGNVHLEKMANKAEEWVMSGVNGQVEVDRGRMVWELIGRLWSGGCSACKKLESALMRVGRRLLEASNTVAKVAV